jgi:hypothetical protein
VRYVPDDLLGAYNPWVNACVVVSLCPDYVCVTIYHAMHDFAVLSGAREEDHVSAPDLPAFVRENFKKIPRFENRSHAGASVSNECRVCLGHIF